MTDNELTNLEKMMTHGYEVREEQLDRMVKMFEQGEKLITESEARIAETNRMIQQLTRVVDTLTATYRDSIQRLSDNRDQITEQNSTLLRLLEAEKKRVVACDKRLQDVIDKILCNNATNVNVR